MAGPRTSSRGLLLVLLALAAGPGCSSPEVIESAQAVFMTRPGCPYVVTNKTRRSFAVLAPRGDFAPRQGDLLVGDLRTGTLSLQVVPFDAQAITGTVPFEVVGHDLSLAEAQALYYGACPLLPDTVRSTGLPLAPEGVPLSVPPDTTGVPR